MSVASLHRLLADAARCLLCPLGLHSKATGVGYDACARGCGHVRRPVAAVPHLVTLKDGSTYTVDAINTHHAASLVVYGRGPLPINPDGTVRGDIKVHPDNIRDVQTLG